MSTPGLSKDTALPQETSGESPDEACKRMSSQHLKHFEGSVPGLTSMDLMEKFSPDDILLVDCRTRPERAVSIIQGAVSLEDLDIHSLPKEKTIITYCSVGFRSGLEGQHIKDILGPNATVYNLDGIISYTHALKSHPSSPPLIDPTTKEPTKEVHCFGKQWAHVAGDYNPHVFSTVESVMRIGQVMSHATVRKAQHATHCMTCQE